MRQLATLAWKEWHEVRAFLWIAFGVFIGLPSVAGVEVAYQYAHGFQFVASPWIGAFGGVLAVFVAVGITCRDLNGHLEDFWRSRPVGVAGWMVIKFFIGLAVVLVACVLPLAIEFALAVHKGEVESYLWYPFFWIALYGLGFLSGCLVGRVAHAAMLGLVGMLLIYLLPFVLPPLEWLNIESVMEEPTRFWLERVEFAAGMLGIAAATFGVSLAAVMRGWRIGSGRKTMYFSVSAAVVILVASAGYQLGTNMPALQRVALNPNETVMEIQMSGDRGYVLTSWDYSWKLVNNLSIRPIKVTAEGMEVGEPIETEVLSSKDPYGKFWGWMGNMSVSPEGHPEIRYYVELTGDNDNCQLELYVVRIDQGSERLVGRWKTKGWASLFVWENRLYVIGDHDVKTLDISQPLSPELISERPVAEDKGIYDFWWDGADVGIEQLPQVPGLSARQRLEAALAYGWRRHLLEGDVFCDSESGGLGEYRLVELTDTSARFQKIGEYKATLLDQVFGSDTFAWGMGIENGFLYVTQRGRFGTTNPHITVYDTRGPRPLREVGHFAAPGLRTFCPLEDGRAIAGGEGAVWLIGQPPVKEGER
jgi:hypothetical protein